MAINISDETFPTDLDFDLSKNDSSFCNFNSLPLVPNKSIICSPEKHEKSSTKKYSTLQVNQSNGISNQNKRPIIGLKTRSQSLEALTASRNNKYSHIPSKVKNYIDEMKRQDTKQKFSRRKSAPILEKNTCTDDMEGEEQEMNSFGEENATLRQQLEEKENIIKENQHIIEDLRRCCESATSNLTEVNSERIKLERKIYQMRIELLHTKEAAIAQSSSLASARRKTGHGYNPKLPLFESTDETDAAPISTSSNGRSTTSTSTTSTSSQTISNHHEISDNKYFEMRNRSQGASISYEHLNHSFSDGDELLAIMSSPSPSKYHVSSSAKKKKKNKRRLRKFTKIFRCCA